MNPSRFLGASAVLWAFGAVLLAAGASAQETTPADPTTAPASMQDDVTPAQAPQPGEVREDRAAAKEPPRLPDGPMSSKALRRGGAHAVGSKAGHASWWSSLLPEVSGPLLTWIAVVVILLLTLRFKPLLSAHNLDGVVLALTALLLALRGSLSMIRVGPVEQTVQWWAYLLLFLAGLYWVMRGLRLSLAKTVPALRPNVSEGAMLVLIVAGLILAGVRIANAPLSDASRDGLIGGIYTAQTGKLPYGDALGHDARSPLLYLLHAGATKLAPPTYGKGTEMRWSDRSVWLDQAVLRTADLKPVQLVNAVLFALLLGAMASIGYRMHSVAAAQTLVVIACVFPGVLECVSQPEFMLPAVLLAWSVAFALMPAVGGLLSVLTIVFAGLAWPWAWLTLPALLAYFFRRRWQAFGATVGLLGGVAATVVGMTVLIAPSLPRADGSLREAGITPTYTARLSDDGIPVIEHYQPSDAIAPSLKKWFWTPLLNQDELRLNAASTQPALPNGVDSAAVMFRDVAATGPARQVLQREYRAVLSQQPEITQMWASLRTLVESTWKPEVKPTPPIRSAWDLWAAAQPAGNWNLIRRTTKIAVVLLALIVAFGLIRGKPAQLHQLTGGLLIICAATLLVSMVGAATNWVWLMPTALAALATRGGSPAPAPATAALQRPPLDLGPAPRITVEP
jgi:hypothetical protein